MKKMPRRKKPSTPSKPQPVKFEGPRPVENLNGKTIEDITVDPIAIRKAVTKKPRRLKK